MTDREKLVELLRQTEINKINGHRVRACVSFQPVVFERMADQLISNGVTVQQWMPVTESLPEPGVVVLVHSKKGCTYFSYRMFCPPKGKSFFIEYSGGWEVTHWMPFPEPPKECE